MFGLKSLRWQLVLIGTLLLYGSADAAVTVFLGKSADQWAQRLTSSDKKQRRTAAFALGKLGATAANYLGELAKLVENDQDAAVRDTAAFAIGEICRDLRKAGLGIPQADEVRKALAGKLTVRGEQELVRRSCAFALGCMGPAAANSLGALDQATGDTSAAVRQNAAWALGQIGAAGVTSLQKLLQRETDPYVIRDVAVAIQTIYENGSKSGDEAEIQKVKGELTRVIPLLARAYNAGRSSGNNRGARDEMRKAVLAALVPIVDKQNGASALGVLQRALSDPLYSCRRNAALALANIGGTSAEAAIPILQHMLEHDDLDFRTQAAAALHNVGPAAASAVPLLRRTLAEQPPRGADKATREKYALLRENSALALGGIGREARTAVPDLVARVADKKEAPSVRNQAAVALKEIGQCDEAIEAISQLVQVLSDFDENPETRAYVLWALRAHEKSGILKKRVDFLNALEKIVATESKARDDTKMLRYDSACLLARYKEGAVSDAAMKTLLEYLKDPHTKVYVGTTISGKGGSEEKKGKGEGGSKVGQGDGRVVAVSALSFVGKQKVRAYPEIVNQLKALASSAKDEGLKKLARQLVEYYRL